MTGPLAAWLGAENVLLGTGLVASFLTAAFYFLPGMRDTETPGHTSRVILSELSEHDGEVIEGPQTGPAPVRPPTG